MTESAAPRDERHFAPPKPRLLVVCEGEVTEKEYINGFIKAARNPLVKVETLGGVVPPRKVVAVAIDRLTNSQKRAKREGDPNIAFDEVWAVFDVDTHPDIAEAKSDAAKAGVKLAISNPCIELWLFLHFGAPPGLVDGDEIHKRLKRHLPNYDKHVDYQKFAAGYPQARSHAERLEIDATEDREEGRNPTTGMWRLTKSIAPDA